MACGIIDKTTDNTNIKLSIIVPIYMVEPYIKRCLKSILDQKISEIEVLLINDASPDRSPEICKKWAHNDFRFKLINHQTNKGVGEARNTGLRNASGEFVFFCDPDDYLPPKVLSRLMAVIENSEIEVVRGMYQECFEDKINEKKIGFHSAYDQINMFTCCMYRLDFLKDHDIWFPNLRIAQDQVFMLKTLLAKPYMIDSDICCYIYCRYNIRFNQNRYSSYDVIPQILAICIMFNLIIEQDGYHYIDSVIASLQHIILLAEYRVRKMKKIELVKLSYTISSLQDTVSLCKMNKKSQCDAEASIKELKCLISKYINE